MMLELMLLVQNDVRTDVIRTNVRADIIRTNAVRADIVRINVALPILQMFR
jgi:hypothetical protein